MPAAVRLREDYSAEELRALARRVKDVNQISLALGSRVAARSADRPTAARRYSRSGLGRCGRRAHLAHMFGTSSCPLPALVALVAQMSLMRSAPARVGSPGRCGRGLGHLFRFALRHGAERRKRDERAQTHSNICCLHRSPPTADRSCAARSCASSSAIGGHG